MEPTDVSPVLLRLRLLASRIGSDLLEEWVRHESEGYPEGVEVPEYRKTGIHYTGTFATATQLLKNTPIPPHIVERVAGKQWVEHFLREPLAEIEHLIHRRDKDPKGKLVLAGSANLIPLLQDEVYPGAACHSIEGNIPENAFVTVQSVVRSKIMDLTLRFEAEAQHDPKQLDTTSSPDAYNRITGSVFYGNVMIGSNVSGHVTQTVPPGNEDSLATAFRIGALRQARSRFGLNHVQGASVGKRIPWRTNQAVVGQERQRCRQADSRQATN